MALGHYWQSGIRSYKQAKRIVVAIIGGTVLLMGLALVVLPGPAFIVIPAGLAILGTEFEWARRWLKKIKALIQTGRPNSAVKVEP